MNTRIFHPSSLVIRELECVDKPFPTCMDSSGFELTLVAVTPNGIAIVQVTVC